MVFYFTPCDPSYSIYMGKDKFENEELIKYGLPTDIWFHVDNMSSAHVYLRMPPNTQLEDIPADVMEDCCQIVKDNSIKGCKEKKVKIVYTPWSNLLKKESMEVGQVGFKVQKLAQIMTINKEPTIVKRLNRTKLEEYPDLVAIKYKYDEEQHKKLQKEKQAQKQRDRERKREQEEEKNIKNYSDLMNSYDMASNRDLEMTEEEFEDSFM